ncbi:MAG: hypothetical protein RJB66_294 [Pseudomonadota bacterium]|jgi:hypothetical protein
MTRLIPIHNCQKNLDFNPETPWTHSLPTYCFENELLCGFERTEGVAIELQTAGLIEAFKAVYPQLGFFELARLSKKFASTPNLKKDLWSHYGYHWKENLEVLIDEIVKLPLDTQRWLQQKKLAPQDLAPLRSLPQQEILEWVWPLMMNPIFSKSDLSQILELVVELTLMEVPREKLVTGASTPQWIKSLKQLRYPQTSSSDGLGDQKIRTIAWPLRSEARWARRGDLSGVELKLFFSHPQELKRSIERLQQVCDDLQTNSAYEDLWSKN